MEKAVIYIRVSSDKQTEESQKMPCIEFCKQHEWDVIGIYADHAKSAYHNVKRKSYDTVLDIVKGKQTNHIVVWALDRWCRKGPKDLKDTITYLNAYDVQLHSVQESWIDTINIPGIGGLVKDFLIGMVAWMAKTESDLKSDRVKSSDKYQKALKKGMVGRPTVQDKLYPIVLPLLKENRSYRYICEHVTYKAKYGKVKHVSIATISEIRKSALEKGDIKSNQ